MQFIKNWTISIFFILSIKIKNAYGYDLENGKEIFVKNCIACHKRGLNVIIPEKNLKRLTLEANGMYSNDAIVYQVLNGKNGMPAFGGRLNETEIENVAEYVLMSAEKNFENN